MKCKAGSRNGRHYLFAREARLMSLGFLILAVCGEPRLGTQESSLETPSVETKPVSENPRPDQPNPRNVGDAPKSSSGGSVVIAAIPVSSPAIGSGATILGGYIFPLRKSDNISPPSIVGGAWVGTNNGTRAWAAGAELYFDQNRYHILSGVAHGDLDYDFYGTGTINGNAGRKFGVNQTGDVFFGEALRRTFWQIFIGPRIWFGTSRLEPQHFGEKHPDLPPLGVNLKMRSLGVKFERETMANRFYPEQGSSFEFGSDFFAKDLGGTFTFQTYRLKFSSYTGLSKKQVLAYNAFLCSTGGDPPFFGQCIFGVQDELRGYPAGRYIDTDMLATQVEYRRVLPWRLGVAVFGGIGEVAPAWSRFNGQNILPSGGIGPRFMLSSKYHVNLRADFAWGKNGNTFSLGLGESF